MDVCMYEGMCVRACMREKKGEGGIRKAKEKQRGRDREGKRK